VSGFTPGPWKQATRGPNGCPIIGDGKGLMVAMITHSANEHDQSVEAEANAHLIAAAPDLLEALESISFRWDTKNLYKIGEAIEASRAAIAKAKGEA